LPIFTVIVIALALAIDAFAVATVVSVILGRITKRQVFRIAFHFGLFQALMPIVGYGAGASVRSYIESWDHWVAFGLLSAIGGKTFVEGFLARKDRGSTGDPTRGLRLVGLSTATSIDALAVGFSFAAIGVDIFLPAVLTGLLTAILSTVGMVLGLRLGMRFGRWTECFGGAVLVIIGVHILVRDLF
jgi:putative Mn2+ efflux pump MntP